MDAFVWIALGVFAAGILLSWWNTTRYHRELNALRGDDAEHGRFEAEHRYRQGRILSMIVKAAGVIVLCVGMARTALA